MSTGDCRMLFEGKNLILILHQHLTFRLSSCQWRENETNKTSHVDSHGLEPCRRRTGRCSFEVAPTVTEFVRQDETTSERWQWKEHLLRIPKQAKYYVRAYTRLCQKLTFVLNFALRDSPSGFGEEPESGVLTRGPGEKHVYFYHNSFSA